VYEASAANVDDLSPGLSIIVKFLNKNLTCPIFTKFWIMLCLMRIKKSRWPEIGHWQLVAASHILTVKVVVT
jgi:hypothetical protein